MWKYGIEFKSFKTARVKRFFEIIKTGNIKKAERAIKKLRNHSFFFRAMNIDCHDEDGRTALFWACTRFNEELVDLLIANGAEINCIRWDEDGRSPLSWAITNFNKELVELLIAKGADINVRDEYGRKTPLLHALDHETRMETIQLLLSKGADVNCKDSNGNTPLHYVLTSHYRKQDSLDIARILASHGANLNIRNNEKETPLICAIKQGEEEIARFLVEEGAQITIDDAGHTPLQLALDAFAHAPLTSSDLAARMVQRKRAESDAQFSASSSPSLTQEALAEIDRLLLELRENKFNRYKGSPNHLARPDQICDELGRNLGNLKHIPPSVATRFRAELWLIDHHFKFEKPHFEVSDDYSESYVAYYDDQTCNFYELLKKQNRDLYYQLLEAIVASEES